MSDDLIKRDDAIEAVKRLSENYTGKGKRDYHPHVDFIVDELKYCVPSADRPSATEIMNAYDEGVRKGIAEAYGAYGADRPQGEWMPFSTAEWISPVADFYKCSICGKRVNLFQMRNYNYCPNCGARMRPRLQGKHFDNIIIDEDAMKGADDE